MPNRHPLTDRLGHRFRDPALLRLALTHPSISHELSTDQEHNQRLEYLGDAVLQLALSRELYDRHPGLDEGPLTKIRAQMVNQSSLAEQGRALELGEHLILSRGEQINGGRERASILADAYEAVLGAIFLDGGYDLARAFVLRTFASQLAEAANDSGLDNPKGALQEIIQSFSSEAPQYQVLNATGPDHDRSFECAVFHLGQELGRGDGKSKKLAETKAAAAALDLLNLRGKPGMDPKAEKVDPAP